MTADYKSNRPCYLCGTGIATTWREGTGWTDDHPCPVCDQMKASHPQVFEFIQRVAFFQRHEQERMAYQPPLRVRNGP